MDLGKYSQLLELGWVPLWTGVCDSFLGPKYTKVKYKGYKQNRGSVVHVKLGKGTRRMFVFVEYTDAYSKDSTILTKYTAEVPMKEVGIYHSDKSEQSELRIAAIQGICPYTVPGYGMTSVLRFDSLKIVGLDIEQSIHYRTPGGFPLPQDPLLSVAIVTNDGMYYARYTTGYCDRTKFPMDSRYDIAKVSNSTELADWIIEWLVLKSPEFVCIHNGYAYDIPRIAFHCSAKYKDLFKIRRLGAKGSGYDFDICGVTVLDTRFYLNKLHRSNYDSFSLDVIARTLGLPGKTNQPSCDIIVEDDNVDMTRMIAYNLHDSYLHLMVAIDSGSILEVTTMTPVFKCPLSDVTRFVSGTMVSTMLSSFALSRGRVMDWSDDTTRSKIRGAFVHEPVRGLHSNVMTFDFASLYPTIMMDANISAETVSDVTFQVLESANITESQLKDERDGSVWWKDDFILTFVADKVARLSLVPISNTAEVLRELVRRRRLPTTGPELGWSLKIGANSCYGAFGASTSKCYSYLAASSVTLIGRWLLTVVSGIACGLRHRVLYGDTDSIFISPTETNHCSRIEFDTILHRILHFTPFKNIRLAWEKSFSKLILVDRKMYYGIVSEDAKGKSGIKMMKGMAPARKDRPKIVRDTVTAVLTVLTETQESGHIQLISRIVVSQRQRIIHKLVPLEECSIETRKGGVLYYKYRTNKGSFVLIDADRMGTAIETPDTDWLIRMLESNVDRILEACDLPTCDRLSSYIQ